MRQTVGCALELLGWETRIKLVDQNILTARNVTLLELEILLRSSSRAVQKQTAAGQQLERKSERKGEKPPTSQVQPIVGPFQPSLSRLLRRPGAFWGSGVGKRPNGESVWTRPNRTPSKLKIPLCACKTENLWSGKASQ